MIFHSTLKAVFEEGFTRSNPLGVAFEYEVNDKLPLVWHVYVDMEGPDEYRKILKSYLLFESDCCGGTIIEPTWEMFMDRTIKDSGLEAFLFCHTCEAKVPWVPTHAAMNMAPWGTEESRGNLARACGALFKLDSLGSLIMANDILSDVAAREAAWTNTSWLRSLRADIIAKATVYGPGQG